MKKVLLSASLLVFALSSSFAQTRAGAIAIGGTLGFSTTSTKSERTVNGVTTTTSGNRSTSIRAVPNISYFLSDRLAIGLGIGYSGNTSQAPEETDQDSGFRYRLKNRTNAVIINPYAKYFIPLGEKVYFFLQGDINVSIGRTKWQQYDDVNNVVVEREPTKSTAIGVGVLPGIFFFPSEKIGLELTLGTPATIGNGGSYLLGYGHQTDKTNGNPEIKDKSNTISFFNLNGVGLGVSVYYFIK